MRIVQLISGGFDSVGQAMLLQAEGHTIYPMYVNFRKGGGKVTKEIRATKEIAAICGWEEPHIVKRRIPKDRIDYRNRLMLMMAGDYADSLGITHIAIGSRYDEEFAHMDPSPKEDLVWEGLHVVLPPEFTLHVGEMPRAEMLMRIDPKDRKILFKSTSCQLWYKVECGGCISCIERHAAFLTVMGYDHTVYEQNPRQSDRWPAFVRAEIRVRDEFKAKQEEQHEQ